MRHLCKESQIPSSEVKLFIFVIKRSGTRFEIEMKYFLLFAISSQAFLNPIMESYLNDKKVQVGEYHSRGVSLKFRIPPYFYNQLERPRWTHFLVDKEQIVHILHKVWEELTMDVITKLLSRKPVAFSEWAITCFSEVQLLQIECGMTISFKLKYVINFHWRIWCSVSNSLKEATRGNEVALHEIMFNTDENYYYE